MRTLGGAISEGRGAKKLEEIQQRWKQESADHWLLTAAERDSKGDGCL